MRKIILMMLLAVVSSSAMAEWVDDHVKLTSYDSDALNWQNFAPLMKKAQAGNAQAQYEIAVMYNYGIGVKMDWPKAVVNFRHHGAISFPA